MSIRMFFFIEGFPYLMFVQHSALQPHRRTIGEGHGAGPQVFMAHILVTIGGMPAQERRGKREMVAVRDMFKLLAFYT